MFGEELCRSFRIQTRARASQGASLARKEIWRLCIFSGLETPREALIFTSSDNALRSDSAYYLRPMSCMSGTVAESVSTQRRRQCHDTNPAPKAFIPIKTRSRMVTSNSHPCVVLAIQEARESEI